MHDSFSTEQHNFYSDYFKRYNVYLSFITPPTVPKKIDETKMYEINIRNQSTNTKPLNMPFIILYLCLALGGYVIILLRSLLICQNTVHHVIQISMMILKISICEL
ncbi:hypothetical protein NQ318_022747 [Aromia moschata]|uniref:Uncharacterized protein n=1 Tax=Aromia moschata TaxID=1265417 RepID=A0AAV8YCI7_9CUCU|nr:hypothetical protein NQ318_022747 [Aromia moschata]